MKTKPEILLIGGGGHCRSVIDVIEQDGKFQIAGIIEPNHGKKVLGYEILGNDDDLKSLFKRYKFALIAIGQIKTPEPRMKIYDKLKTIGYQLPSIFSPFSYVSKHAFIDEGSIIMHQGLINSNAKIGKNCIINTKALIEHDAIVEDFCHISTGAIVNGECRVQKGSFLGTNTALKHSQTLEQNSIYFNEKQYQNSIGVGGEH